MADLLAGFTVLPGQVILGLIIFGVGLLLPKLVSKAILSTAPRQASLLAMLARIAIMVLAGAIALALAFGVGGPEIVAKKLEEWVKSMEINQ